MKISEKIQFVLALMVLVGLFALAGWLSYKDSQIERPYDFERMSSNTFGSSFWRYTDYEYNIVCFFLTDHGMSMVESAKSAPECFPLGDLKSGSVEVPEEVLARMTNR